MDRGSKAQFHVNDNLNLTTQCRLLRVPFLFSCFLIKPMFTNIAPVSVTIRMLCCHLSYSKLLSNLANKINTVSGTLFTFGLITHRWHNIVCKNQLVAGKNVFSGVDHVCCELSQVRWTCSNELSTTDVRYVQDFRRVGGYVVRLRRHVCCRFSSSRRYYQPEH